MMNSKDPMFNPFMGYEEGCVTPEIEREMKKHIMFLLTRELKNYSVGDLSRLLKQKIVSYVSFFHSNIVFGFRLKTSDDYYIEVALQGHKCIKFTFNDLNRDVMFKNHEINDNVLQISELMVGDENFRSIRFYYQ